MSINIDTIPDESLSELFNIEPDRRPTEKLRPTHVVTRVIEVKHDPRSKFSTQHEIRIFTNRPY